VRTNFARISNATTKFSIPSEHEGSRVANGLWHMTNRRSTTYSGTFHKTGLRLQTQNLAPN